MAPAAKRRKTEQLDELKFDPSARQDYLTGFHKRKLQRIKHAQEENAKKDKEEKVVARRQLREQRREDLSRHVAEVNAVMRDLNPDIAVEPEVEDEDEEDVEWGGIEEAPKIDGTDEYVDEDKYTTVTIETMEDPRDTRGSSEEADAAKVIKEDEKVALTADGKPYAAAKKRVWTKEKPTDGRPKKRKPKFRYETKAERKQGRQKQKAKNSAAAKERKAK